MKMKNFNWTFDEVISIDKFEKQVDN